MKFQMEIRGQEKLNRALEVLDKAAQTVFVVALQRSVVLVHEEAVKSIQEHRSQGRRYGKHVASKPGYPPNSDTGLLASSIKFEVDAKELHARVGTNLKYGADLELKRDRAWLQPAYLKSRDGIKKYFRVKISKKG